MLRSSGLKIIGHPGHEIYLCEPGEKGAAVEDAELQAAALAVTSDL